MPRHYLTKDNRVVTICHFGRSSDRQQLYHRVSPYLESAIGSIEPNEDPRQEIIVDMRRPVGHTFVVETQSGDRIVWAQRPGKDWVSRFVLGRRPAPTNEMTVIIVRNGHSFQLVDAYLGGFVPSEPPARHCEDRQESREFWRNHAFVWSPERIAQGTELGPEEAALLEARLSQ